MGFNLTRLLKMYPRMNAFKVIGSRIMGKMAGFQGLTQHQLGRRYQMQMEWQTGSRTQARQDAIKKEQMQAWPKLGHRTGRMQPGTQPATW